MAGNLEQENNFRNFLGLLNVSSLGEARLLSSSALQAANEVQVRNSTKGWTYGRHTFTLWLQCAIVMLMMNARTCG
jgi:hypothetical protein